MLMGSRKRKAHLFHPGRVKPPWKKTKKKSRKSQLATELKEEVDKTDSAKVLSLAMLKKAEEIEKLAKDIKSRAKG